MAQDLLGGKYSWKIAKSNAATLGATHSGSGAFELDRYTGGEVYLYLEQGSTGAPTGDWAITVMVKLNDGPTGPDFLPVHVFDPANGISKPLVMGGNGLDGLGLLRIPPVRGNFLGFEVTDATTTGAIHCYWVWK